VRGSGDARLHAKYDAAVHTIRRALALYPYVRSPLLCRTCTTSPWPSQSLLSLRCLPASPSQHVARAFVHGWVWCIGLASAHMLLRRPGCIAPCLRTECSRAVSSFVIDAYDQWIFVLALAHPRHLNLCVGPTEKRDSVISIQA
jgi:hypothetical protein